MKDLYIQLYKRNRHWLERMEMDPEKYLEQDDKEADGEVIQDSNRRRIERRVGKEVGRR